MSDEKQATAAAAEGTNTPAGDKTFTQEQLNAIVGERLAKEKQKTENALAERERELTEREFRLSAKQMLEEKGLPSSLLDALNTSSPEAFDEALSIISKHMDIKKETVPRIVAPGIRAMDTSDPVRDAMGLKR